MKKTLLLFCLLGTAVVYGQLVTPDFIDTLLQTHDTSFTYGSSVDFGGNMDDHEMDVTYPTNDNALPAGRPLIIIVHGGAFMAGSKNETTIAAMREDFAQRGYVAAAINYRLGMFQTSANWHCNISNFGVAWDCLNQADTLEWYRGFYRGVQDVHGAIRYLVNHAADYNIDPDNVYVVGESAGAFIAMGVGFMDTPGEIPTGVGALADAPVPNNIYDQPCVQGYGLDTNIASLDLARPDLGSYLGTMNPSSIPYRIRGVGDMYGAMFQDFFAVNADDARIPCLYIFHQPNDLIVPIGYDRVLAGYAYCAVTNFGCAYILNRPYGSGGMALKQLLDNHILQSDPVPDYLAEFTTNNADCMTQLFNPSVGGHQYDNYWLRTNNMAIFFAPKVLASPKPIAHISVELFPNPSTGEFRVVLPHGIHATTLSLLDMMGRNVYAVAVQGNAFAVQLPAQLSRGTYMAMLHTTEGIVTKRIMLHYK
jgi:acetyl esterase/lipase